MTGLAIADGFDLPIEYVTSTGGILAKKGAGKSNAAVVMAEAMFDAGVPWVAIDPKGDWWGVRAGRDGGPGLPVIVFGGQHGDVPLEPSAGKLIAALVMEQRFTCVLDVSEFTKGEVRKFLDAFGDGLFRGARGEPLHLFLEEAHEYLPQVVRSDDALMVERWQKIVKMGRTKGLGVTIVSQRSAAVNKDVLTQCDYLFVLRTTSPQDRLAVKAWVDVHADAGEALKTMPSLKDGEAWVWFPEGEEQLRRITFHRRRTFDSGATPKIGEKARPPATLADVDLGAIKEAMAETIEKAKADDPKELRKTISALQRQLKEATEHATPATPEIVEVEISVPVLTPDAVAGLRAAAAQMEKVADALGDPLQTLVNVADAVVNAVEGARHADQGERVPRARPASRRADPVERPRPAQRPDPPQRRDTGRAAVPRSETSDAELGKGERAVLIAVAQHGATSREALTVMLGYKRSSRNTYIQRLVAAGYVVTSGNSVAVTEEGRHALGDDYEPLPTGDALRDWWLNKLTGGEREILRLLIDEHPFWVERDEISDRTEYKRSSRNTYLQRLRTRELIDVDGSTVRASDILFG